MNYDLTDIPANYDKGRDHGREFLDLWMRTIESLIANGSISTILDLGCGTGRFSDVLAVHFDTEVIGVDPSAKMLDQARRKQHRGRVRYEHGAAEAIPLPAASVDLIFTSMTFHHFTDRLLAARECRRVLRTGGNLFVRTGTREQVASYPYVPFFPPALSKLAGLLPDHRTLREPFEAAGFSLEVSTVVTQRIADSWETYAAKLAAGGDSVLATLSQEELVAGLAAVRRFGEGREGQAVDEPIDLFVFR